jgi:heme-degrading monooxygenase HmoA
LVTWDEPAQDDLAPGEERASRIAVRLEDGRTMPYLLLSHRVHDYEQWKSAFDAHSLTRQANGSRGGQLFRSASDPNELIVLLEWDVLETARQFAQSEDFHELMQQAGVVGIPSISFLKDGEQVAR